MRQISADQFKITNSTTLKEHSTKIDLQADEDTVKDALKDVRKDLGDWQQKAIVKRSVQLQGAWRVGSVRNGYVCRSGGAGAAPSQKKEDDGQRRCGDGGREGGGGRGGC